ncbi:MAG: ABC transporter permease [Opitutales bacterium]|jgi:NitT/TauT family transport system permease protein
MSDTRTAPRPWFSIRKELGQRRRLILTAASFLMPVAVWMLVSYCPFIWHPDVKLQFSADRENVTTVFSAGDHVSKEYFPQFLADVRAENTAVLKGREDGSGESGSRYRRANQKLMRQMAPVAVANGWLTYDQAADDVSIYKVWKGVADGTLKPNGITLSSENLAIVRRNWALMSALSPEFDARKLPEVPLEKLVPQGVPANPVYLPAPHEVIEQGYKDFTKVTDPDKPTMGQRFKQSVYIILAGFFLSCLIGIPLGVMCGTFDFFSKLFEPFVDFFRYMPAPVFSTLLVAVFLAHDAPKIALVFVGTFFQMVLIVANTTRQLDVSLLEAAQTLGAKHFTLIRRVILPGITPNLYNDLRILLGWSWTWLVIAELIGVKSGLTEFIETQGRWRNFESVYPVIILIGITGFTTDQILSAMRRYFFPWTPEASEKKRGPIGRFFHWLLDTSVYDKPLKGKTSR